MLMSYLLLIFAILVSGCGGQMMVKKDWSVIAHRGASGVLPEHTLAAKAAAHVMNPDYIEQDVVMTQDDELVVMHDIHLDTTTNVKKVFPKRARKDGRYYVIDFTLAELKQLKVSERFHLKSDEKVYPQRFPVFQSAFQIATLSEEIELIQGMNQSRNKNIGLYVEIKAPEFHKKVGKKILKKVVDTLHSYGYKEASDNVYLQCFDFNSIKALNNMTKLKLVQLIGENSWSESSTDYDYLKTSEGVKEMSQVVDGVGPWWSQLTAGGRATNFLKLLQKKGLTIHPYTFRKDQLPKTFSSYEEWIRHFTVDLKVDGVFADFPEETIALKSRL